MAYEIRPSREMPEDLKWLSAGERAVIDKALPKYLRDEPIRRSTHRKELDPNPFEAPWELRLGDLRVLYSVDEAAQLVRVLRAGRKPGNTLYIRGVAYDLREKA
jgi:mRNA-degrading endonuclease RelE of RelBE toxin-antitoxin system